LNYTGIIKVVINDKSKFCTKYKYNADMYLYQLNKFFNSNEKNKIKRMFLDMEYATLNDYVEMVKLAGLHDYYNFDEKTWTDPEGHKKFLVMYPELDNRCFINDFSGMNVFESMLQTGRLKVLDNNSAFNANYDFKYIINLDEWAMSIKSQYYPDKVIALPTKEGK